MTIEYIETRAEMSWRKTPDIPLIVLPLPDCEGYGHVKKWLEENIENILYIMIDNNIDTDKFGISISSSEILIVFSQEEDYTGFKLMFPEYC